MFNRFQRSSDIAKPIEAHTKRPTIFTLRKKDPVSIGSLIQLGCPFLYQSASAIAIPEASIQSHQEQLNDLAIDAFLEHFPVNSVYMQLAGNEVWKSEYNKRQPRVCKR